MALCFVVLIFVNVFNKFASSSIPYFDFFNCGEPSFGLKQFGIVCSLMIHKKKKKKSELAKTNFINQFGHF